MKNCTQSAVVDGAQSNKVHVESEVLQDTIPGTLLFLLHNNDLSSNVNSTVQLFTDDCLLYHPILDQLNQAALQNDLDLLTTWCSK